jgi:hypothetical protein
VVWNKSYFLDIADLLKQSFSAGQISWYQVWDPLKRFPRFVWSRLAPGTKIVPTCSQKLSSAISKSSAPKTSHDANRDGDEENTPPPIVKSSETVSCPSSGQPMLSQSYASTHFCQDASPLEETRPSSSFKETASTDSPTTLAEDQKAEEMPEAALLRLIDDRVTARLAELGGGASFNHGGRSVVISANSLEAGFSDAVRTRGKHANLRSSWNGTRVACEYYRSRGVVVHVVASATAVEHFALPSDLAEDVIVAPMANPDAGRSATILMFRLAMALACPYVVDNSQMHYTDLPADVLDWHSGGGCRHCVEFVFGLDGAFVPLRPPPRLPRGQSGGAASECLE